MLHWWWPGWDFGSDLLDVSSLNRGGHSRPLNLLLRQCLQWPFGREFPLTSSCSPKGCAYLRSSTILGCPECSASLIIGPNSPLNPDAMNRSSWSCPAEWCRSSAGHYHAPPYRAERVPFFAARARLLIQGRGLNITSNNNEYKTYHLQESCGNKIVQANHEKL